MNGPNKFKTQELNISQTTTLPIHFVSHGKIKLFITVFPLIYIYNKACIYTNMWRVITLLMYTTYRNYGKAKLHDSINYNII